MLQQASSPLRGQLGKTRKTGGFAVPWLQVKGAKLQLNFVTGFEEPDSALLPPSGSSWSSSYHLAKYVGGRKAKERTLTPARLLLFCSVGGSPT